MEDKSSKEWSDNRCTFTFSIIVTAIVLFAFSFTPIALILIAISTISYYGLIKLFGSGFVIGGALLVLVFLVLICMLLPGIIGKMNF